MKYLILLLSFFSFAQSSTDCYLEQFVGDDISNEKANGKALCDCIETGKQIQLLDKTYYVAVDKTFFTNNNIVIKGMGKDVSKLVFVTKGIPYFDSMRQPVYENGVKVGVESGLNMSFENLSMVTGNYEKYKNDNYLTNTKFTDFYYLQRVSAKDRIINVDYINVKNCFVGGSLEITLSTKFKSATDYEEINGTAAGAIENFHKTTPKYRVKEVNIEDSYFDYPWTFVSVSAFPQVANVNRNNIHNLRQSFAKFSYADIINVNDNHVKNDFIAEPGMTYSSGYISLLMGLGANKLEGRHNTMTDVLSRSGSEVSFVFPSVRNLIWEENTSINSFSLSPPTSMGVEVYLFKLKQAENYRLARNNFTIDREGYKKMGLLADVDSPIESANKNHYFSFLSPSNDYLPGFTTEIIDNTFTIPHINRATLLMSDNNTITGNMFNVEYVATITSPLKASVYNKPNLLFSIEGAERGYLKFNYNAFNIGKAYGDKLNVMGFERCSHTLIENCGNSYYFTRPTTASFGRVSNEELKKEGYAAQTYKATDNYINKGSIEDLGGIYFESVPYPFTESHSASYTIGNSTGKTAETHIANLDSFGKSGVEVLQNNSDSFGVFRFLASDFVGKVLNKYFESKTVDVNIKITALNSNGIEETLYYKVDVNNRSSIAYSGAKFPVTQKQLFKREVANAEKKPTTIKLMHRNFSADASYLTFEGLTNYKSFKVSVTVQKK